MRHSQLYRYRLPLTAGQILRDRRLTHREGLIVCLHENGQQGWGEIAPLPGFSLESLPQAIDATCQWLALWNRAQSPVPPPGDGLASPPLTAPNHATEADKTGSASGQYQAHRVTPLIKTADSRPPATDHYRPPARLPQNSAIPLPALPSVAFGLSCALAELNHSLPDAANYQSVPLLTLPLTGQPLPAQTRLAKCKVARTDPHTEAQQLNQLLDHSPRLTLRLDANRGWTLHQAHQFAACLRPEHYQRIRFIEEPCQSAGQSCIFSRDSGLPIAWDETLREQSLHKQPLHKQQQAHPHHPGFPLSRLRATGVTALVIKPMLTGSLTQTAQLIALADAHQLTAIISSSIESSLGLSQLARLARWLTPHTPPGLDTLSLLGAQLIRQWPNSRLPCLSAQQLEQLC